MYKIAFIIPTIRDKSLYMPAIESIQDNKTVDIHLATNVAAYKQEGNIHYHPDLRMDGAISALNVVVNSIKDDYDYFLTFTDETRLINDWRPILDVVETTKHKIVSFSAEHPCYLPHFGEPDSPPYDYGNILTMRFPVFSRKFLDFSDGVLFNTNFKYAACDLWLSYWVTYSGGQCIEVEEVKLKTITSKPVDSQQKINDRYKDLQLFFALVQKHYLTNILSYNMGPSW